MSRIFISYKRVDKEKVFKIKDQIESALGEKCWIDLLGIESRDVFETKIIGAINLCEVFLFMYSASHFYIDDFENDWTIRELNFASQKKKNIVFINLDGSDLSDWFSFRFGMKQQIDARINDQINRLIADMRKWLDIQELAPTNKLGNITDLQNNSSIFDDPDFLNIISSEDEQWNVLIDLILKGDIIPVFGPDFLLGGRNVHQQILDFFSKHLKIGKELHSFSELVDTPQYIAKFHDDEVLYYMIDKVSEQLKYKSNEKIERLLGCRMFPFVISLSFTPILESVMKRVWGDNVLSLNFCNHPLENDDITNETDLRKPTVFYMLGKSSTRPHSFCVTEEDFFNFSSSLSSLEKHLAPQNLVKALKHKKLLFIGNSLGKTTFLMLMKNICGTWSTSTYVYNSNKDKTLRDYLSRKNVHVIRGIDSFINDLCDRLIKVMKDRNISSPYEPIDIYISSSRTDSSITRKLSTHLKEKGLHVRTTIDNQNVLTSEDYFFEVKQAIRRASYFIPLLTMNIEVEAQEACFYRREWSEAVKYSKYLGRQYIIPIANNNFDFYNSHFPEEFKSVNSFVFSDENDIKDISNKIFEIISKQQGN